MYCGSGDYISTLGRTKFLLSFEGYYPMKAFHIILQMPQWTKIVTPDSHKSPFE